MEQAPRSHGSDPISGLDGLRALAALAVFGVHFNQVVGFDYRLGSFSIHTLLANGNHGVSLFFSLSGLLLSLPYWQALSNQARFPDTWAYLFRRMARILPAYYVALTGLLLFSGLWRIPEARWDILLHYTFLFNYTEFSIFSINPPFWTMAVETQFYVLLPGIFFLFRKFSADRPGRALIFLGIGAYGLHYWLMSTVSTVIPWPFNPWLAWIRPYGAVLSHSILANLPHFLIGLAAGKWYIDHGQKIDTASRRARYTSESLFWLCCLAVAFLLGTGYAESFEAPYAPYGLPLMPLLLAVMIVAAPFTHIARWLLDGFLLRRLGLISYGIYIFHLPCLNFLDRYMNTSGIDAAAHGLLFGLLGLLLTILIASISYHAVEKPVINFVRNKVNREAA